MPLCTNGSLFLRYPPLYAIVITGNTNKKDFSSELFSRRILIISMWSASIHQILYSHDEVAQDMFNGVVCGAVAGVVAKTGILTVPLFSTSLFPLFLSLYSIAILL